MNESYTNIYNQLFDRYLDVDSRSSYLIEERQVIYGNNVYSSDQAFRTLKASIDRYTDILRADAKYFLLINFHQMILVPVLRNPGVLKKSPLPARLNVEPILSAIHADIDTIINNTPIPPDEGISGHQIMETINRNWRELQTTKLKIWG